MAKKFIIGTRGSLLAVTQTTLIKNLLEEKTQASFEIKTLKTQGDIQTDKPLWQYDGKDFFTKELDQALLEKKIDLVVHSYKDLGSERPQGIHLAAVTKREFAHDILFIKNSTISKLSSLDEIIIGTSSPRRIVNIESSLKNFLPNCENKTIKCKTLRGNVNTRIQKLQNDEYHAIVLAFAGCERLCHLDNSKQELELLLKDLNFMILPQSEFPSSASQGALAIECLEENSSLKEILKAVHDSQTQKEVAIEREHFQSYGGGCHLAIGIHAQSFNDGFLLYKKGQTESKQIYERSYSGLDFLKFFGPYENEKVFLGLPLKKIREKKQNFIYDELIEKLAKPIIQEKHCYFVTSSYCAESIGPGESFIFASGNKTWKKMAAKGVWVNGSSDSLGHEQITQFQKSLLLNIFFKGRLWKVLSHGESQSEVGEVLEAYERKVLSPKPEFIKRLQEASVFFWTSFFQYETYKSHLNPSKKLIHCCGTGKTLEEFQKNKIQVVPIADMNQWTQFFKG